MVKMNLNSLVDDGILAFSIGDELKAKELLSSAINFDPHFLPALRAIAEVSLSLDELDQAEEFCRRALSENENDLASTVSLARILVKKGDKVGAEEASAKARILGWKEELSSE